MKGEKPRILLCTVHVKVFLFWKFSSAQITIISNQVRIFIFGFWFSIVLKVHFLSSLFNSFLVTTNLLFDHDWGNTTILMLTLSVLFWSLIVDFLFPCTIAFFLFYFCLLFLLVSFSKSGYILMILRGWGIRDKSRRLPETGPFSLREMIDLGSNSEMDSIMPYGCKIQF